MTSRFTSVLAVFVALAIGLVVHPKAFHDAGNSVIVEVRYTGTVKATGKSVDAQACHIWDVKDGKVTRFQQYVDTAKLWTVMGVK